jgi:1-acyl-sn-glycerol-3-phosphate acyltransferase
MSPADAVKPRRSPWWIWGPCHSICRITCSVWFDFKAHGIKNVPKKGGALLICNHQSFLDPAFLGVQLPRQISFMAKMELFETFFWGRLIHNLNTFPVRRGEADVGAIREALRRMHEGHVLAMFPEGTRSRNGELLPIQAGIALMIKRAEAPVIPAVVDGTWRAWPRGKKFPTKAPVRMLYGPPLDVKNMKGPQIVRHVEGTFRSMLTELREWYPELKPRE